MNHQLSIALAGNPRTWPILDGSVKPDGIDLTPRLVGLEEVFAASTMDE